MAYETLSETEFGHDTDSKFQPNIIVDISHFLGSKLKLLQIYQSELGEFSFSNSKTAVSTLVQYRGATAGFRATEAFVLLREGISS